MKRIQGIPWWTKVGLNAVTVFKKCGTGKLKNFRESGEMVNFKGDSVN